MSKDNKKKYPNIKDDDFYERINKQYKRYTIPNKKKTIKQICFPQEYELQMPQKFLAYYINPNTPYKGILIFHRIGAGKTCTAVNIAEQWKHDRKIIVVVPASLIGNFRDELRSPCAKNNYLTQIERNKLKTLHPSSDAYKKIIKKSDERIDKYYNIYSYNKFVELAEAEEMSLHNSLLIIDEVQNMISEYGTYYQTLFDTIHSAPASLRIVALSATPMFDKPIEIALTMNVLRIPFQFPLGNEFEKMFIEKKLNKRTGKVRLKAKNLDEFKERIKGYVSYYGGAPSVAFPESTVRYIRCPMSDFQYRSYFAVQKTEEQKYKTIKRRKLQKMKKGEIIALPNNFYIGTRIISNVSFPNRCIKEEGFVSFKGPCLTMENLEKYSTKFYQIMKRINRATGPVFVYSNFKEYGGIKSFARVLEHQGYKNYINYGEGRKRFAIWSGDESMHTREEIKQVFNLGDNYNGSKLRVLAITPSGKEGLSLYNVNQIHILEPYWNQSRLRQIIGRGIRYCSHKDLPEEKRFVKVFIYLATHPDIKESIDEYIMNLAKQKNILIGEFEKAMKEAAVDCQLFKFGNKMAGDKNIVCDK